MFILKINLIFIKLLYFIKYDKLLKFKQNYVNKKILNLI